MSDWPNSSSNSALVVIWYWYVVLSFFRQSIMLFKIVRQFPFSSMSLLFWFRLSPVCRRRFFIIIPMDLKPFFAFFTTWKILTFYFLFYSVLVLQEDYFFLIFWIYCDFVYFPHLDLVTFSVAFFVKPVNDSERTSFNNVH